MSGSSCCNIFYIIFLYCSFCPCHSRTITGRHVGEIELQLLVCCWLSSVIPQESEKCNLASWVSFWPSVGEWVQPHTYWVTEWIMTTAAQWPDGVMRMACTQTMMRKTVSRLMGLWWKDICNCSLQMHNQLVLSHSLYGVTSICLVVWSGATGDFGFFLCSAGSPLCSWKIWIQGACGAPS